MLFDIMVLSKKKGTPQGGVRVAIMYVVKVLTYGGFGQWDADVVDVFDNYDDAKECEQACRENGLNSFVDVIA